jgi:hypothetical protein
LALVVRALLEAEKVIGDQVRAGIVRAQRMKVRVDGDTLDWKVRHRGSDQWEGLGRMRQ